MTNRTRWSVLAALAATALTLVACAEDDPLAERELEVSGPDDGALFNAEQVGDVEVSVAATLRTDAADPSTVDTDGIVHLADVRLLLGGEDITDEVEPEGDTAWRWAPGELPDGEHDIAVVRLPLRNVSEDGGGSDDSDGDDNGDGSEGSDPGAVEVADVDPASALDEEADTDAELLGRWRIEVDATAPELEITVPEGGLVAGEPVTITGSSEPGATVTIGDAEVAAGEDGSFEVELAAPPEGRLAVAATDVAGNRTDDELDRLVTVPSRARVDELRTVHVSFCGWASPSLREPVLEAIEAGRINAIQLDLKDETGKIGFDTENELAQRIGSDDPDCRIDLPAAIEQLHGLGIPVVGRIVAFADPVLAPWAWANDQRDYAIQEVGGGAIYTGRYAGFANFANEDVREYNIAIAEEAAAMGVDHILWDYLRKPDGSLDKMSIPGLEGSVEDTIVSFTREADERLAPYGALHGASLYGVSADRPSEVGQDVERLAEVLDYVSPMIYPSHWGPGEYDVSNPLMQPYDIVSATLEVWMEATEGRRAQVIPWLEDSNWPIRLGYPDRAEYVREQVRATYDAGITEWLLWDSSVNYTESGMIQPPAG